ncbi:MAG: glycoside hydrolase family 64 protein [Actinomycetota bacterium]|nr:glycoside hydrolase family 64 protein [Actinomycetota bacterium]
MISRRAFLGTGAAALTAPVLLDLGLGTRQRAGAATPAPPATLAVNLVNNTGTRPVYAYVTGMAPDNGGAWMFLQADGHTPYYPPSPSAPQTPLGANCSIPLGSSGSTSITVPHLVGGRVWFSIGAPLQFFVNPGPGIVMPSVSNPSDPNINIQWGFCELTYDSSQLYANISFVDFVSLPIALSLQSSDGSQTVNGLPSGGLDRVCTALRAQAAADGSDWAKLIQTDGSGRNLRAVSPNLGGSSLFAGYLDDYVNQCWSKYAGTDLTIDTQYTWGTVTGRVSGDTLTFPGVGSFTKPSTYAIFNCSTAPFTTGNDEMGNLTARLAAALNRTTLLNNANQPDGENVANFYAQPRTNHYARILHQNTAGGLGYAFPYDDVHASGGTDVEGKVQDGNPGTFTITVGSPS